MIRQQVEAIDARIVGLLLQRARLVQEAARYGGMLNEARKRQETLQRVRYRAEHHNMAERIYRTLLDEMLALEKREAGL
ncbi:chorismate mutase [Meiothermus rufus]|uniref:chorismate mutase n=1 Tax=Meiothermus rufus TaxID=604332 RepID=UPI001FDF519D|nr:chorismate mutase [Meiothermus rufus]